MAKRNRSLMGRSISIALCLLVCISVIGQDCQATDQEVPGHVLAGHRYLPSFFFPNPFAVPTFELDLSVAYGKFSTLLMDSERELKVGALGPKLEAQIKLIDRLMFIAGLEGDVAFGVNGESVGLYGASARYRPRLGILWGAIQAERMSLSFGLEAEKPVIVQASPIEVAARELESLLRRTETSSDGVQRTDVTRWRPTARIAYTLSEMFGITGFTGLSLNAESVNEISSDRTLYLIGIGLDTNFKPLWKIPLAANLNFVHSDFLKGEGASTRLFTLGIFEAFSDRYNFGVEFGQLVRGNSTIDVGSFVTRYYY